ncbi:hypothetical protein V8E51_003995 [Hyaloscypha variabilis]
MVSTPPRGSLASLRKRSRKRYDLCFHARGDHAGIERVLPISFSELSSLQLENGSLSNTPTGFAQCDRSEIEVHGNPGEGMEQFDSQVCEESFLTFSDIEIESHMAGHSISTFEDSIRLFPPPATSTMRETQLLAQEVQIGSMALDFYGLERSVATVYQSMHNKSEKPNDWDTTTLSCPLLSQPPLGLIKFLCQSQKLTLLKMAILLRMPLAFAPKPSLNHSLSHDELQPCCQPRSDSYRHEL